jgi:pimeloyl-ACP methyl ester carboxylesterase
MPEWHLDGARVEYEWIGPAPEAAPTMVFLHEGLGSRAAWRTFPGRMAAAAAMGALVYSRPGYGGSDPLPRPWPTTFMHDEARRLPAVLRAAGVRRPVLFGHSDGASIALLHAAAGPDGVRALVLEAPHVFVEETSVRSIRALRERYRTTHLASRWRRTQGAHADATFAAWTDVWLRPEFRRWNIEDALPKVRCPVLVLQGTDDEYGTFAQVDAIRAGVVGPVVVHVLSGCGHAPHRERLEDTLAVAGRFLAGLSPT